MHTLAAKRRNRVVAVMVAFSFIQPASGVKNYETVYRYRDAENGQRRGEGGDVEGGKVGEQPHELYRGDKCSHSDTVQCCEGWTLGKLFSQLSSGQASMSVCWTWTRLIIQSDGLIAGKRGDKIVPSYVFSDWDILDGTLSLPLYSLKFNPRWKNQTVSLLAKWIFYVAMSRLFGE